MRSCGRRRQAPAGPTGSGDPGRGRRLGALLRLYGGGNTDHRAFWDGLPLDQQAALVGLTDDDLHLLNACLEVERRVLDRECRMAEHLLLYDLFGEEELCEALDRDDLDRRHVAAMWALGLLDV